MTRPAPVRQAEIARTLRAVRDSGLPCRVEIVDGKISLLPIAANAPLNDAEEMERRMKDAFGE